MPTPTSTIATDPAETSIRADAATTRTAPDSRKGGGRVGRGYSAFERVSPASRLLVLAVMIIFAVYSLLPVWWLVVSATKPGGELFTGNGFWFGDSFDLVENIGTLFTTQDGIFSRWLLNSLLYAGVGGAVSTLLSVMCGYALAKFDFPGREAVFGTVLAAVLLPAPILAVPLYLLFSSTGVINTFWAVFIPSIVSPFGVYLARIYAASSVPDSLIEAGRIDGAREFRIFAMGTRIMAPAMVTIFLFQFVAIWTNYLLPSLMLAGNALQPVTVGLINWRDMDGFPVSYITVVTGALVSVVPIVIMFLSLQGFWSKGLTAGSEK
ncbi:carbohydrate ABC transporter permease [Compostimonas suwonensis]|uniref:Multiple sugar transport system permease protein n=1 Tax=Compostimonas suwonensis TaxID=1048394 RepID=A0A2M9BCZ3_9MICO|nr:carbohydrate ABC transporter permease [Compostimonas suwonensis]PJJ55792.1 multiple sugar transport system permease protein [Compostimonas suwonensis]